MWSAAYELAQAKQFVAAKNYLLLHLFYAPPAKEVDEACSEAVTDSRPTAARRSKDAKTWGTFSPDWRDRLRIGYVLLVTTQHTETLKAWIEMLFLSEGFFGGAESHLIFALIQLVKKNCFGPARFEPGANVFSINDKTERWQPALILPPEDDSGPRLQPNKPVGSAAKKPAAAAPAAAPAPAPEKKGGLMAPTAASAITSAANAAMNVSKAAAEPTFRIRLKQTANHPQRTVWLKHNEVVRDVQAGTSKMYLPGLLLLEAARLGCEAIVTALLEAGVSIYEVDDEASSALTNASFYASTPGHREVCSKLVEKNADPEMFNMNKLSPLDIALKRSDTQLRRIFRPSESDKDFTPAARKQSNLHAAIESNDEEIAAIELGGIGAADAAKIQGVTPLMMAARVGSATLAQMLLDQGAHVEFKSKHGCTPFSVAAEEGHVDVMRALLACEVSIKLLLAPDTAGNTPLIRACENGHKEAAELTLAAAGDSVEMVNATGKGSTALMHAAHNGFDKVVKLLLESGAQAEIEKKLKKSDTGLTALCYACMSGHAACVRVLVAHAEECPLEAQGGSYALKLAQANGNLECVKLLQEAGCEDADAAEEEGKDAKDEGGKAGAKEDAKAAAQAKMKLMSKRTAGGMDKAKRDAILLSGATRAAHGTDGVTGDAPASGDGTTAADVEQIFDVADLEKLEAQYAEEAKKLAEMKATIEKMKAVHDKIEKGSSREGKPPWAYSPSGRWAPGLWMGPHERAPISNAKGEPPRSISWVNNWIYHAKMLSA